MAILSNVCVYACLCVTLMVVEDFAENSLFSSFFYIIIMTIIPERVK